MREFKKNETTGSTRALLTLYYIKDLNYKLKIYLHNMTEKNYLNNSLSSVDSYNNCAEIFNNSDSQVKKKYLFLNFLIKIGV